LNVDKGLIDQVLVNEISSFQKLCYEDLLNNNKKAWAKKWNESDIIIEGDIVAQQAIRFNIFQLNCTYSGNDERLNIGPKGFTGEKYGGSTYWDTEAYCLPFYQSTADKSVARNLLIYRYNHLSKAIENAEKLGFSGGAALYPMVTMNGEECHNEWEITFEEIHRNGAIAYAIYDYINYTADKKYLAEYGLEVLIGIARFWKQRVNWSEEKQAYVMLGVTGPNEFENNVNNNWYTNKMATWCLNYCEESIDWVKENYPTDYQRICKVSDFDENERKAWALITNQMYYPFSDKYNIYLQQDGFLDKELIPVSQLSDDERPIVEHWSWDKILRSCYIKQADVLQGLYYFENEFTQEELQRHYDFYEPLTVHESSLSPCIHSILAAKLGDEKRAYDFYLRTARLDLNDYNNDTRDGLHITSMAGTWMTIIKGFAGMEVKNDQLIFSPLLPKNWESLSFKIKFRDEIQHVFLDKNGIKININ
jgi:maltose phosphorylase